MNLSHSSLPDFDASVIGCVLVLYHPEELVVDTITRLAGAGYRVCAVINTADRDLIATLETIAGVNLIKNPCNIGLAAALNQGIVCAFDDSRVGFVTLFDQDSSPDCDLPKNLAQELLLLKLTETACISPSLQDKKALDSIYKTGKTSFVAEEVLTLPTSGTLIPRMVYERVGPMKNDFFVDAIDHEWCFRAQRLGIKRLVSSKTSMIHNMGDVAVNWFGQFKPVHHSPLRHYYIVRNHLYLVINGPAPFIWRCQEFFKLLRRIVFYPFASKSPKQSVQLILWAIYDGVAGNLGECGHVAT
jgi:rhamnosyltransferase